MPKVADLSNVDPVAQPAGEEEHNPIFDVLVTRESEIAGLVANSIYKQNKRAWLLVGRVAEFGGITDSALPMPGTLEPFATPKFGDASD